jgi:hypothetical protein
MQVVFPDGKSWAPESTFQIYLTFFSLRAYQKMAFMLFRLVVVLVLEIHPRKPRTSRRMRR